MAERAHGQSRPVKRHKWEHGGLEKKEARRSKDPAEAVTRRNSPKLATIDEITESKRVKVLGLGQSQIFIFESEHGLTQRSRERVYGLQHIIEEEWRTLLLLWCISP